MKIKNHNDNYISCAINGNEAQKICKNKKQPSPFEVHPRDNIACIYLLDAKNKCAFIYSSKSYLPPDFKDEIARTPVHKEAHKKGFEGQKISYQWYCDKYPDDFYQSVIIPMPEESGNCAYLLCIVKVISKADLGAPLKIHETPTPTLSQMIMLAREEEKRKITSILHDEIGSSAVFINSLLSLIKEDIKDGNKEDALKNVANVETALDQSIDRLKKTIISMRPPQLADIGLDAGVKELIESFADTTKLEFDYSYNINENFKMSEIIKITLYRIVQEALNNIAKHAQATKVEIKFTEERSCIRLLIKDDGVGFEKRRTRSIKKLGLLGMQEGVAYLGGSLKIQSEKGCGTTIFVDCPKVSYARNI